MIPRSWIQRKGLWTCGWVVICASAWVLLTAGCNPNGAGCGVALGDWTTDTLTLPQGIEGLEVNDRIRLTWDPSAAIPSAVIHAGSGVIEGLSVLEEDQVLRIEDLNSCHWSRRLDAVPHVELRGMQFKDIQLMGQGDFIMTDTLLGGDLMVVCNEMAGDAHLLFHGDTLRFLSPNGVGHARMEGEAIRFRSFCGGFGDLDAEGLQTQQMMFHHAGLGRVDLRPEGYLFLEMSGHGDVHLYGPGDQRDIRISDGATGSLIEWP